ncbi:hypothetical protein BV25DRAFT_1769569, partial [Artomyces pyxidatus]
MSNTMTSLVPVLDGSNYQTWSDAMEAYLMAQGTWHVIVTTQPDDTTRPAWDADNYKAMGVIRLRCTPQIAAKIKGSLLAVTMWETLEKEYGKPGISAIFSEFKAALAVEIPNNAHPAAAIDEIAMHFSR